MFDAYPEYNIKLNEDEKKFLIGKLQHFDTELFSWCEETSDGNIFINDPNRKILKIEKCSTKEEKFNGEIQYIFNTKYFIISLFKSTLVKIIEIIKILARDINMNDVFKELDRVY